MAEFRNISFMSPPTQRSEQEDLAVGEEESVSSECAIPDRSGNTPIEDEESEGNDSLGALPCNNEGSILSFSVGGKSTDEWMHNVLDILDPTEPDMISLSSDMMSGIHSSGGHTYNTDTKSVTPSQNMMTVESDMLSGIFSGAEESMAMLSLDTNGIEKGGASVAENEAKAQNNQKESLPMLSCVHDGSTTKIYRLNDPKNKLGGEAKSVAVKVLSDQFPSESQLARLENEKNMSTLLACKCAAVRAALSSTFSSSMGMLLGESSSRTLCLEWVHGVTLKEWAFVQRKQLNGNSGSSSGDVGEMSRYKPFLRMACKIANSLSEIHEVGEVVLNNISSSNIIVNDASEDNNEYDVHMIGLGSASLLRNSQNKEAEIQKDLRSLGGVFFELFSGQRPFLEEFSGNESANFDDEMGSVAVNSSRAVGNKEEPYRPLRELRSILSMAAVPSKVATFVLELMGAFKFSSDNYYYRSAQEVGGQLTKMILKLEVLALCSTNQESSNLQGLLNFDPNCLYGREEQQAVLMSAFERVILRGGPREVVLVSGFSGTGKTAFVAQTVCQPIMNRGGHFLHVKFDQLCQAKPLAAILSVFTDFCDKVVASNDRNIAWLKMVLKSIEDAIGLEGPSMLAKLIPTFREGVEDTVEKVNDNAEGSMSQNRLNLLFQAFIRVITSPQNPMVLFLDDLQWADESSLSLIRALIMDYENSSLLFIESYRTNEVTEGSHPFSVQVNELKAKVTVNELQIKNLDAGDVNELLSDAIREPRSSTEALSTSIYRKTSGNVLLTIQFVKSLWDEGLIWFSFYNNTWKWDSTTIESREVPEDAATLIAQKILYFPLNLQQMLKAMACLGSQCEKSIISLIGSGWGNDSSAGADIAYNLSRNIDIAVHEGILDKIGSKYKFAHDQIQLATYSLIPTDEQSLWHLQIGQRMINAHKDEDLDTMLFVVVDQLNRGKASISEEALLVHLAELNLRAGERAKVSGVFSSSASYFAQGISILETRHWSSHYELLLCLYNEHADSEFRSGNFEKMADSLECVFTHGRCFDDMLFAYRTLILSLGAQKKLRKAVETGLFVLEEAGQKIPVDADASTVQAELLKTERMLVGKTFDILINKNMDDKRMLLVMEISESLYLYSFYCKHPSLPFFPCRMIQLTVRHGFCASTCCGFAIYSMMMCGKFGDVQLGKRYGRLSLDMLERMKCWNQRCRTLAILYGYVFPRTEHLHSIQEPLFNAYHDSIKEGDTEWAIVNAALLSTVSYQGGKKLISVVKFLDDMKRKATEYKQEPTMQVVLPMKQAILNLMGKTNNNPALLEGEVVSFKEYFLAPEEKRNTQVTCRLYLYQMQVAYMFGDFERAVEMSRKNDDMKQALFGKFDCCEVAFYVGLITLAVARRTNEDDLRELAYKSMKEVQKWTVDAPRNCEHKLLLLEAEQCFLEKRDATAAQKYDSAIILAGKNGFIQDQAISYERAAMYHFEKGDEVKASQYYGKAHDAYLEWGAKGKADFMCRQSPF